MEEERVALVHLNRVDGLGPIRIRHLLARFGTASNALSRPATAWAAGLGIPQEAVERALSSAVKRRSQEELRRAEGDGIRVLCWGDPLYPSCLETIEASPPVLYAQGDLRPLGEAIRRLTLVGTRTPTPYGKAQAERFAAAFAAAGAAVVSGLARGIDRTAHRAALESGGRTIAVLGSGLSRIYPDDDPDFLAAMKKGGLLVSEFPLETEPRRGNFPRRNRILAGLSEGVFVAEAAAESGSLITAQWAIDQGKEVFALPGRVDSPMSRGCHALLKVGCYLVEDPEEVLATMGWIPAGPPPPEAGRPGGLLGSLNGEMKTVDQLSEETGRAPEEILEELLRLEVSGLVVRGPGGLYRRPSGR